MKLFVVALLAAPCVWALPATDEKTPTLDARLTAPEKIERTLATPTAMPAKQNPGELAASANVATTAAPASVATTAAPASAPATLSSADKEVLKQELKQEIVAELEQREAKMAALKQDIVAELEQRQAKVTAKGTIQGNPFAQGPNACAGSGSVGGCRMKADCSGLEGSCDGCRASGTGVSCDRTTVTYSGGGGCFAKHSTAACKVLDMTESADAAFGACYRGDKTAAAERVLMSTLVTGDTVLTSSSGKMATSRVVGNQHVHAETT